jgi:predicted ATPase/DNA-binding SARP family transcriptional activator
LRLCSATIACTGGKSVGGEKRQVSVTLLDRSTGQGQETAPLDVLILGHLDVIRDGESVRLGGHRQRAILARLLVEPGRVVSRDRLIDDVWEGRPPPTAAKTLHKYVSELRRALEPTGEARAHGVVRTVRQDYVVDLDVDQLDAWRFERAVAQAARAREAGDHRRTVELLRPALATWRGEVLADFADSMFTVPERVRLDELRMAALEQLFDSELALGHHGEITFELRDQLEAHPLRERLWALYMTALAESGRVADALRAFQRFRWQLGEELGLEPSAALSELEACIIRGELPVAFTHRVSTRVGPAGNLPTPLTSFVGRESLQREIAEALARRRLVTLTGPGGSGKTRVAIEVAHQLRGRFSGGAWLVDLSSVRDPAGVPGAVADVLGIPAQPGRTYTDVVGDALALRGPTLMVLDNCEHLACSCADLLGTLLVRCTELQVLATSRRALGVAGGQVTPVLPLDIDTEAVALFCDRAQLARADVAASPADPGVVDLCRQLDGLPLAIELVASAVQALQPAELLAERMGRILRIESLAPTLDRHRSLRATIEWSLDLVSPEARALFRRLSAFAGSFTLDAAEGLCAGADLDRKDVFPLLNELLSNSLIRRDPRSDSMRSGFSMLETLRAFAREQLDQAGEVDATMRRHLEVMTALAESSSSNVLGPDELVWRRRLDLARHDIRIAIQFACERDPLGGFRLALALWPYWLVWGHFDEGLDQLRALLEAAPRVDPRLRSWVLVAAADLGADAGEARLATVWAEEALAAFRRDGLAVGEACALRALANAQFNRGDVDEAARLLGVAADRLDGSEDPIVSIHIAYLHGFVETRRGEYEAAEATFWSSLHACRQMGSRLAEARALWILGTVAQCRGDLTAARELCEQSVDRLIHLDDNLSLARVQAILGDIVRLQGDDGRARRLYESAVTGLRSVGDQRGVASALTGMGTIALRFGDVASAGDLFLECLGIRERLGDDAGLAECYEGLAAAHRAGGQPRYAARLVAVADACRSAVAGAGRPSLAEVSARWTHRRPE